MALVATKNGNVWVTSALMHLGADINRANQVRVRSARWRYTLTCCIDKAGITPLEAAVRAGNYNMTEWLLQSGAFVHASKVESKSHKAAFDCATCRRYVTVSRGDGQKH